MKKARLKQLIPSAVSSDYWLHSRPPKEISKEIDQGCSKWLVSHADKYASSGSIYPRDISKEELMIPRDEPELTLRALDLEAIKHAKELVTPKNSLDSDFVRMMLSTALAGKWLVYTPKSEIDETWKNLSSAIETGRLPYDAKVSTAKDNKLSNDKDLHVVCVYTPNYLFREDVRKCRRLLFDLGFTNRLYYKPDIMTMRGMYRVTGSRINHRYFG